MKASLSAKLKELSRHHGSMPLKNINAATCAAAVMLGLSVQDFDSKWSTAEVAVCTSVCAACAVSAACIICGRRKASFDNADLLVGLWTLYLCLNTVGSDFPCSTTFLKSIWPCLLYFSVKPIFNRHKLNEETFILLLVVSGLCEALYGYSQLFTGSRHHMYAVTVFMMAKNGPLLFPETTINICSPKKQNPISSNDRIGINDLRLYVCQCT